MTNQPLTAGEQSKVMIFILLLLPLVFFLVGIIPAIFLIFGVVMMKKSGDFGHIETAVRNFKGYVILALILGILVSAYFIFLHFTAEDRIYEYSGEYKYTEDIFTSLILSVVPFIYLMLINNLFINPLRLHIEWIVANGIFASKPKENKKQSEKYDVDIINSEKLKSYSVADELLKWAKLKEDGHISEQEFNDARKKLLKRD